MATPATGRTGEGIPGPLAIIGGGPLRVAVVGAGRFGRVHARKIAATAGVELAAVVDRIPSRARDLAAPYGVPAFDRVAHLSDTPRGPVHGAVVAVDLAQLADVTGRLLDRGLHVLAEKPLALDGAAARALVALAERRRRLLAVGFVERFAVPALSGRRLVARRVGARRSASPLVLDWMVHDLDHALRFLGAGLEPVEARIGAEYARIRLVAGDREARLTADSRRDLPRRRMWLDQRRIDPTGTRDPLAAEIAAFCGAMRGEPAGPLATGADAVAVLSLLDRLNIASTAA